MTNKRCGPQSCSSTIVVVFFPHRVDDEIVLTLFTPLHAEQFYALVDQNRKHLGRWLRWVSRYQSVTDATTFAKASLQRMAKMSALGSLVWYRGDPAGWVELLNIDRTKQKREIGFWLAEYYQHRGIARRADHTKVAEKRSAGCCQPGRYRQRQACSDSISPSEDLKRFPHTQCIHNSGSRYRVSVYYADESKA